MLELDDMQILSCLRNNSREPIGRISKKLDMPQSKIHCKLRYYEGGLIKKHTSLIDFEKMGFYARVNIAVKVDKEDMEKLHRFIVAHERINTAHRTNKDFDFIIDCIFKDWSELRRFTERLAERFKIRDKKIIQLIEPLKEEAFLTDACHVTYNDLI